MSLMIIEDGKIVSSSIHPELRAKVGYFSTNFVAGDQAITGLGFKPKTLFFVATENSVPSKKCASWGISDGIVAHENCSFDGSNKGTAGSYADTYSITDAIAMMYVRSPTDGGYQAFWGTIKSFDPDGFTVTWSAPGAPSGSIVISYMAIG